MRDIFFSCLKGVLLADGGAGRQSLVIEESQDLSDGDHGRDGTMSTCLVCPATALTHASMS